MVAIRTTSLDPESSEGEPGPADWTRVAALMLFVAVWLANSSGLVSSNDGSHLALARALALRGESSIEAERALTLEVDLAERGELAYSDRPPGTAFAAAPAVWLGARFDEAMFERALGQAKAGAEVHPLPGATPYLLTYAKRARRGSPRLVGLIASSVAICCHAALVGLLGLLLIDGLLRRLGHEFDARLFALACLALASAWGPYSTALFSHVSAATGVTGFLLGVLTLADPDEPAAWWIAPATGLAGAWAISCDYLLVVAIVPAAALSLPWRRYLPVLLGTLPIVIATLTYHHAAFGSVTAIGYDHQRNFAFARERGSTFSGALGPGLWVLWGAGRGAGLLAQAPIILAGALASPWTATRSNTASAAHRRAWSRVLIAFVPWALMLAMHRTPWGGGSEDHRYLIPMFPLAAVGLALLWRRLERSWQRAGLLALALLSLALIWTHFLAWHEGVPFDRLGLGAGAALAVLLAAAGGRAIRQKLRASDLSR